MNYDQHDNELPASRGEKIFTIAFAALIFIMLVIEIANDYQPKKLSAILFLLYWMPLVALHEFAHAVVARMVGWNVGVIVVGFGKTVWRSEYKSIPVEIRMIPIEGFILCSPKDMDKPRLKDAVIHFAGPGVELLVFLLILLIMGPDDLFRITNDYSKIVAQSLAFCALIGAALNLIPHGTVTMQGGEIANDGLAILRCAFTSDKAYEKLIEKDK